MKKVLLAILLAIFGTQTLSSAPYDLLVDPDFSPYSGGQNLITGMRILQLSEDIMLPPKDEPKEGLGVSFGRFAELFFIWNPLGELATVTQHEVFGHGYRIRELPSSHVKVTNYKIGWPFPYSLTGGGATGFRMTDRATVTEINTINIAGIEAQDILARQLKMKWVGDGRIDARMSQLYFLSQQSLFLYGRATGLYDLDVSLSGADEDPFDGNDLKSYVYWMNRLYPNNKISISYLKGQSYYNWLDVFTYYSFGAWWYYVATGKQFKVPMFKIGKVKFLPSFKVTLAPYGLEKNLEGYFAINGAPLYVYGKWGDHGGVSFYGAGIDFDQMLSWKGGIFGFKLDVWYQPDFQQPTRVFDVLVDDVNPAVPGLKDRSLGFAGSLISRWYLTGGGSPLYLYTEAGYKSKGYLPGYSLDRGFIGRVGLTAKF
ncbi:hypothetical protein [Simkania sp.]|uniref:hypothetical protein n=1 Tax=Simkania sp. TaxID=34094 RepID=UPI003B5208FB